MKIYEKPAGFGTGGRVRYFTVEEAVEASMSDTMRNGELEQLRERCDSQDKVIAKLVGLLHANNTLSDEDVQGMLSYRFSIEDESGKVEPPPWAQCNCGHTYASHANGGCAFKRITIGGNKARCKCSGFNAVSPTK